MDILYSTSVKVVGGRTGSAQSSDGLLDLTLATVKELGGPGGVGTNPEQLFAAGYAACFVSTLRLIANPKSLIAADASVVATVGIGKRSDGTGFALEIALVVDLPGLDPIAAQSLVDQADVVCPYSHLAHNGAAVSITLA